MKKLQKLKDKVKELEDKYDKKEQIQVLQDINALLLTDYEIRIGDNVIHPLRIEAYYLPYNEKGKFDDDATHTSDDKIRSFGKLYFIEPTYGYPGIDICLSNGEYYLSFLIKNSYIGDKTYKQVDLYDKFIGMKNILKNEVILFDMPHKHEIVFNTVRVGLNNKTFAHELLASVIDIHKRENGVSVFDWEKGYGKQWTIAVYALSNTCNEASARELAQYLNGAKIEDEYWNSAKKSLGML